MPEKELFIELTRACWIAGKPYGVGSIVKLPQRDALYIAKGLDKAKLVDARSESTVAVGEKKKPADEKKK